MLHFDLVRTPHSLAILLIGLAVLVYTRIRKAKAVKSVARPQTKDVENLEEAYYDIEPLRDLNLENEEPIKLRPFKPKYHLTMSVEKTTMSDLVVMDKTYVSRIHHRRDLLRDHHDSVLALNPIAEPAVNELYTWLMTNYLPKRFPTVYTLSTDGLYNRATQETIPLTPASTHDALEIIGGTVDTDFLFLLPIPGPHPDEGKYRLEAFMTCFPSGFSTRNKLNLKLADIHTPVPGYAAKLEKSMDRFFASLPAGKIVKRANWTITTTRDLFVTKGNHIHDEDDMHAQKAKGIDLKETVLRTERQTLHRLPQTGALVFAFKTFQYELADVKAEGSGEELCEAIDGLGLGSVPEFTVYKRQIIWGEAVKAFMRS